MLRALPHFSISMERCYRCLRWSGVLLRNFAMNSAIPAGNYLRWLGTAIRLAPRGMLRSIHSNKAHLRNVPVRATFLSTDSIFFPTQYAVSHGTPRKDTR